MMPGMDGYITARQIRKISAVNTTIVGVTALQEDKYRYEGWDNGFNFFLVKPLPPDQLQGILDNLSKTIMVQEDYRRKKASGIQGLVNKLQRMPKEQTQD